MRRLETLLTRFARQAEARWWIGSRPDGGDGDMGRAIAGMVGYPTASHDPFAADGMVRLNRRQAAHVLAVAGTTSLAYGQPTPSETALREAFEALEEMAGDAVFLGNGLWDVRSALVWNPLSAATFDCGLIGFDQSNAFIFWVEEED